jgi:hypothetical protein
MKSLASSSQWRPQRRAIPVSTRHHSPPTRNGVWMARNSSKFQKVLATNSQWRVEGESGGQEFAMANNITREAS